MCWSGEASFALAALGLSTTAYAAWKGEPRPLWICLGYFSLMELLQAYTYVYINQCGVPQNQIATLLGYLHIAFQPVFINAISLHFIPKIVRTRIETPVYILSFASAIFMIIQLYPFDWAGHCAGMRPLCAERLCSVSGDWHIAWEVPSNGIGNTFEGSMLASYGFTTYGIMAFYAPILYGSWPMTLYHFALGPILSGRLTDNINEWPAIWCLLSIGLLVIVVKTPIRKILYVRWWPLWRLVLTREEYRNVKPDHTPNS